MVQLSDFNRAAYCPVCETLEPFAVQDEVRYSRKALAKVGAVEVIAQFLSCDTKAHLVVKA